MVKIAEAFSAGLIVFLIAVIGQPLWISLDFSLGFFLIGIGLIVLAGILDWLGRYTFLKLLFALWGFAWTILFFFYVFPEFSISLL